MAEKDMVTAEFLGTLLDCTAKEVYDKARQGAIPFWVAYGPKKRWAKQVIIDWLEAGQPAGDPPKYIGPIVASRF